MRSEAALEVSEDLPIEKQLQLDKLLDRHNIDVTGIHDARVLSVTAHSDSGRFLGGIHGHTWGGYCEIKTLFVVEQERGKGLGRRMIEAAEAEAVRRGCRQVILSTHGFQAPRFYERLGYDCLATIPDCPLGSSYHLMMKRLKRDCI